MAYHTPLALGEILPHTLGPITHLGMLRPITPQGSKHLPFTWQQPNASLLLDVPPAGLPD